MKQFQNPDGTYNGVNLMSSITGLSTDEIRWTWERLRHLMHVEKKSKEEAKAIVVAEGRNKPWKQS